MDSHFEIVKPIMLSSSFRRRCLYHTEYNDSEVPVGGEATRPLENNGLCAFSYSSKSIQRKEARIVPKIRTVEGEEARALQLVHNINSNQASVVV